MNEPQPGWPPQPKPKKPGEMSSLRAWVGAIAIVILVYLAYQGLSGSKASPAVNVPPPVVRTLESQMSVTTTTCNSEGAKGTVTNGSASTVDVYIQTAYLDSAGTMLDDGIDSVSGLRPGETADWEAGYFGGKFVKSCRAEVSSAFAK